MKRKITLYLLSMVLTASVLKAQKVFERCYNGGIGYSIIQKTDGGFIIFADSSFYSGYYMGAHFFRTDAAGNRYGISPLIRSNLIGGANYFGFEMRKVSDGGFIIPGWSSVGSSGSGISMLSLTKMDTVNFWVWVKTYLSPTAANPVVSTIETTDKGFILACGNFLIKTNSTGDSLWYKTIGPVTDRGKVVRQTADGGYIIAGLTSDSNYDNAVKLTKTNSTGDTLWSKNYGFSTPGQMLDVYSMEITSDGGFIIVGRKDVFDNTANFNFTHAYAIKTDNAGVLSWQKIFYPNDQYNYKEAHSVIQTNDGGYLIGGLVKDSIDYNNNMLVMKTDATGGITWKKTFGDTNGINDFISQVIQTNDGGYALTGYLGLEGGKNFKLHQNNVLVTGTALIRTDANGNVVSGINENLVADENNFIVYPNPAMDQLTIHARSLEEESVSVWITDVLGKRLMAVQLKDANEIKINIEGLSKGLYLLTIKDDESSSQIKFIKE